jgi:hypothetical protein
MQATGSERAQFLHGVIDADLSKSRDRQTGTGTSSLEAQSRS